MGWLTYFLYLALITICYAENCDKHGILVYDDLGCSPVFSNSSACPTKYNCENFGEPGSNQCYFKGENFTLQTTIFPEVHRRCNYLCICLENAILPSNATGIRCAHSYCDHEPKLKPSCKLTYSLDDCCATGQICEPYTNLTTCNVGEDKFLEGELFYAPDTCQDCLCQKDFNGKFEEPICRRRICGIQLGNETANVQNYCAPIYRKNPQGGILCCPDDWICSNNLEKIEGTPKSDETCRFGNKTIKVGETFERTDVPEKHGEKYSKIQCQCSIPPLLTCHEI